MQRKISIPALVILAAALITAIGSVSFLGPCVHEDGSFGACHWAGRAELGIACLIAAQSLLLLFQKNAGARCGLYMAILLTAALGMLVPGTLIGLCGMATMRCRALMKPAMTLLFALMGILALAGIFPEIHPSGLKQGRTGNP